jgi:branched-chain amino acid transport system ATP-binding protein
MLRVRNLESGYGGLVVLKGISLHISAGEIVAIIGANGAGKSTLLNTIAGLVRPFGGTLAFQGQDIAGQPAEKIVGLGCSLVAEGRKLFASMSVRENLTLGAYLRYRRQERAAIAGALEHVLSLFPRLKERESQLAGTLSGGEQQMVAIGRALMADPDLIMMDEPSMGLAPLIIRDIFRVISLLRDQGKTILVVEQNANAILKIANRGYVMETGSLIMEGTSEELLGNPDVRRAYLGKDYRSIADREGA